MQTHHCPSPAPVLQTPLYCCRDSRLERVVHSVHVGCDEGEVTWCVPHGALRVSFTTPPPTDDVIYDVCCVVSSVYCDVRLSLDAAGATLRPIAVLRSSSSTWKSEEELCFRSSGRHATSLYVESLTSHVVGRVVVDYDIRRHVNTSRDMRGESTWLRCVVLLKRHTVVWLLTGRAVWSGV